MQLHLALYDPSFPGEERNYWTWRSAEIPSDLLKNCYYDYLIKHKPQNPELISATDVHGGMFYLSDWVVVYRFFNGGRDTHGRPGRYVILTGWIKRSEINNEAPVDVLTAGLFDSLSNTIPPCPVPKPNLLDCTVFGTVSYCNNTLLKLTDGKYEFPAGTALSEAIGSFFSLNKHTGQYQLLVHQSKTESVLTIQKIEEKPVQPTINSPHPNNSESTPTGTNSQPKITFRMTTDSDDSDTTEDLENTVNEEEKEDMKLAQLNFIVSFALLVLMLTLYIGQTRLQKRLRIDLEQLRNQTQELQLQHQEYLQQVGNLQKQLKAQQVIQPQPGKQTTPPTPRGEKSTLPPPPADSKVNADSEVNTPSNPQIQGEQGETQPKSIWSRLIFW